MYRMANTLKNLIRLDYYLEQKFITRKYVLFLHFQL